MRNFLLDACLKNHIHKVQDKPQLVFEYYIVVKRDKYNDINEASKKQFKISESDRPSKSIRYSTINYIIYGMVRQKTKNEVTKI